ncbi:hypothetical protein CIW52_20315 [Mycolicibacterium sp. P9-64]|uniref:hypothetical protein n=1 Tax=Mycolicibacterium sp. P9-64 TaxID=2024612 RepID=UPI0011ECA59D|nr:hypothetical protein [Mycolicibacterium sp. P9-64]KAA0082023.1 hypothetical protein CIW52_20315 [Mycolicibacterium sp. P9-64]
MGSRQQDWLEILAALPTVGRAERRVVTWSATLRARLWAGRYDRQIEDGTSPTPGSPLAVHRARLVTPSERNDLARALQLAMHDSVTSSHLNARVPTHAVAVQDCAELIAAVCDRLIDPLPVRVRGMARLRILLADGRGPMYRYGRGTLNAALRGVLAAL